MEIVKSNQGNDKICLNGYTYTYQKYCKFFKRWRCAKYIAILKTSIQNSNLREIHEHKYIIILPVKMLGHLYIYFEINLVSYDFDAKAFFWYSETLLCKAIFPNSFIHDKLFAFLTRVIATYIEVIQQF
ncbi:Uncharacterized protein FWK35_00008026 [Aphis craccivora]|uniref:FLYWCH-type domain-containing protein n=1 Tax=Aphis craccivora TaxID=307492 RepID=A0A6G0YMR2_APHCR|nr:Uncharacterized protein FWK35_00008026 [Aphis craccivora]